MELDSLYNKKRKGEWVNEIRIEECAAKLLQHDRDQSYCAEIINFCHSTFTDISHNITDRETNYVLQFVGIKSIDSRFLQAIIIKYGMIRNVVIKPVSAANSEDSKPYYTLVIDIFSYSNDTTYVNVPIFRPFDSIPSQITREKFASTACGNENDWKDEWNTPFTMIKNICDAVCNKEQFPSDMGLSLLYETTNLKRQIYGIKFMNFGDIPYSLIEYVDDIKATDYMYYIKFESGDDMKNNMIIKIVQSLSENNDKREIINGQCFFQNLPKRNIPVSSRESASTRFRVAEEDAEKREKKNKMVNLKTILETVEKEAENKNENKSKSKLDILYSWLSDSKFQK